MGRIRGGFLKVAAAVPVVKVAHCAANAEAISSLITSAAERGVSVVAFPELSITGATCGDLFCQGQLLDAAEAALESLLTHFEPIVSVVGMPIRYNSHLYDCAVVISEGVIYGVVPKSYSSNPIFTAGRGTENRYINLCDQMVPFGSDLIFTLDGVKFGVEIGEDAMQIITPSSELASAGAAITLTLDAMPECSGSYTEVEERISSHSKSIVGGHIYCSAGCGESSTDLVFAGNAIIAQQGEVLAVRERFSRTPAFTVAEIDVEQIEAARLKANSTTLCDC